MNSLRFDRTNCKEKQTCIDFQHRAKHLPNSLTWSFPCGSCREGRARMLDGFKPEPDDSAYGHLKTHYCKMGHRKDRISTTGRSYCKVCTTIRDRERKDKRNARRREKRKAEKEARA